MHNSTYANMIDQENTVIIANLKAYLNGDDLLRWITVFVRGLKAIDTQGKAIIVCPPASHTRTFYDYIASHGHKNISLGMQDVSQYGQGAYTGEVTGAAVFGVATFALLGHSERRQYLKETPEMIQEKIKTATFFGMHAVVCISKPEKYEGLVYAYAYEPLGAIGTGKAEPVEEAASMLMELKRSSYVPNYLYGGSVNETNVKKYIKAGYSGVLVGTASKDPEQFLAVIRGV